MSLSGFNLDGTFHSNKASKESYASRSLGVEVALFVRRERHYCVQLR